jgi:pyruvate/2-oxoglutarate dehydrogenase complex dihydrolipoamide dehydrogenase (E3) component
MAEDFDAIVIGMGPGGEVAALRMLEGGLRVAVVEKELIGGECSYWACIPSKTLLRPVEARAEAERVAGLSRPDLDWPQLRDYRDYMVRHLDDSAQADSYSKQGAVVFRGGAKITGPGQVEVNGRRLSSAHVIVATGSTPVRPPIAGLDQVPVWTNRELTNLSQIPSRALVVGGGAVGVEMGQFLARMGSGVTIIQRAPRLLDREDPALSALIAKQLAGDGIDIRLGTEAVSARRDGSGALVELADGTRVSVSVIVLAAGRSPNSSGLGLEAAGVTLGRRGELMVDGSCQAGPGLWAVGDVTGVALFTHTAMYQARIATGAILGRARPADYRAVPRVVFTEPEIAAVGLTLARAREQGIDAVSTQIDLAATLARPWTFETKPGGTLTLIADRQRRTVIGAWAMAPLAGEWIHVAALAVRHCLTVEDLADGIAQFPTFCQAFAHAAQKLEKELNGF